MSSTAIVAIFIPIVLRVGAETSLNASRMLLPMSYAALINGMLTLIASPPSGQSCTRKCGPETFS